MTIDTAAATRRKAVRAAGIGNFVEWYDFGLYGYFATTIATQFFPGHDPTAQLLATFAVFAVGFLIRPAGGIVFGRLGDRIGRRAALTAAIILMSVATLVIGLLPSYGAVGLLAPVLLTLCRLAQGFSAGGEQVGANTFIIEYAPHGQRGRYASTIPIWIAAGTASAALVAFGTAQLLPPEWGWRLPFLLAGPLGVIGLYLRLRIEDSPEFRAVQQAGEIAQAPLSEAVRTAKARMLVLFGFAMANAVGFYLMASYLTSYIIKELGRSPQLALGSSTIALVVFAASAAIGGRLLDRYGRVPVAVAATITLAALAVPAFLLIGTDHLVAVLLGQGIIGFCLGAISCTTCLLTVELFPAHIRYSAAALSYNLCYTAFGGTAAYVATWLVATTNAPVAPAVYLTGAAIIGACTAAIGLPRSLPRSPAPSPNAAAVPNT
ncbi:MHS family proline/betaine transporter-like MFS transporter [Thermocatellispora tengchongensis]|uniref:Putative proline/betaine transporter n=1 Tax=Thermocatellispora tengchongensis TaxID=1073253 RepID=A0A840PDN1_9ACTN|nr:MFS transporter [Thermocatellispora tengchongensis]MBB5135540.1 MHS family proline/betaine transporter-like MFS transporter [Thermocatellispora tengchongensis]